MLSGFHNDTFLSLRAFVHTQSITLPLRASPHTVESNCYVVTCRCRCYLYRKHSRNYCNMAKKGLQRWHGTAIYCKLRLQIARVSSSNYCFCVPCNAVSNSNVCKRVFVVLLQLDERKYMILYAANLWPIVAVTSSPWPGCFLTLLTTLPSLGNIAK